MTNYTIKKPEKQGLDLPSFIHTPITQCRPLSRCNNYKKCKACHTIYRNKQLKLLTDHLDEASIRQYKHKEYLVFTSLDTHKNPVYKNADIENFINELIRTKRNKSSVLNGAQYLTIKEISYSRDKGFNPHVNCLYFSNTKFVQSQAFKKLASKYNIKVHVTHIYRTDNSYLKSIKKIINYSLKYDPNRKKLEIDFDVTKGQRDIKKSDLFNREKFMDLHKRLYKYICQISRHYGRKRREAIKLYKNFNKSKPATRVKMLKSLNKKLKRIESARKYYTALARQGLTKGKITTYTHLIHTD